MDVTYAQTTCNGHDLHNVAVLKAHATDMLVLLFWIIEVM